MEKPRINFYIPLQDDSQELIQLAVDTGLFTPDEAEAIFTEVLATFWDSPDNPAHRILAVKESETAQILAWAFWSESAVAPQVWDLWWLGVSPKHQAKGLGAMLLQEIEADVTTKNARLLIIETSSRPDMAYVRKFYASAGYHDSGVVPHFYAINEGKHTFAKPMFKS